MLANGQHRIRWLAFQRLCWTNGWFSSKATGRGGQRVVGISGAQFSYNHRPELNSRPFSTSRDSEEEKGKLSEAENSISLLDASGRGVGQVIFLNSPLSGGLLMAGLALGGDPFLPLLAGVGTLTSTGIATLSGLNKTAIRDGLMGYNGCLVGCAAAGFMGPTSSVLGATAFAVVGSAATPFVAAALAPAMGRVPQWTIAFNLVTLSVLLRSQPLLPVTSDTSQSTLEMAAPATDFLSVALSPFVGVSQIFVVESALTGLVITAAVAHYSPRLAGHILLGSAVGTAVGWVVDAPMADLVAGLWGYNSALTSLGTAVFFTPSNSALAVSAGGAAATAICFGAFQSVMGGTLNTPCLTLPFCIVMSGCYLLADSGIPGLMLESSSEETEKS